MGSLELSLLLDVVILHKFKMPNFVKYSETTYLKAHMIMFCHKMARHTENDKLLSHYFQESLTGSTTKWYTKLDRGQIHTSINLVKVFLAQYDHVVDTAPDRMSLMTMENKKTKSFKDYAQRWQDFASKVQPLLTEKRQPSSS